MSGMIEHGLANGILERGKPKTPAEKKTILAKKKKLKSHKKLNTTSRRGNPRTIMTTEDTLG